MSINFVDQIGMIQNLIGKKVMNIVGLMYLNGENFESKNPVEIFIYYGDVKTKAFGIRCSSDGFSLSVFESLPNPVLLGAYGETVARSIYLDNMVFGESNIDSIRVRCDEERVSLIDIGGTDFSFRVFNCGDELLYDERRVHYVDEDNMVLLEKNDS